MYNRQNGRRKTAHNLFDVIVKMEDGKRFGNNEMSKMFLELQVTGNGGEPLSATS